MHRVNHDPQSRPTYPVEIDKSPDIIQIQRLRIEILHKPALHALRKRSNLGLSLVLGSCYVTL